MSAVRDVSLLPKAGAEVQPAVQVVTPPKAGARAITMNLITGGLGSAIFSLPWSVAGSSIIPSVVIVGVVLMLNAWTISIVVRVADKHNVFNLGGVIRHLPGGIGKPLQHVTNVFVWISMFLCLVSYIIVIHDSAITFVKGSWLESRFVLVSLASVLVLPLCFLSQSLLEKTSALAIAVNVYLFILIGVLYGQAASNDNLPTGCCMLGVTIRGDFAMATVMFQAEIIQMCVLPMYEELENRSPKKFDKIVAIAFSALFFIFCGFSIFGYLLIGPSVHSNILEDLPKSTGTSVAQAGTILVVACVYPIMVYPMIAPIQSRDIRTVAKVVIVLGAMVCAAFVEQLGEVNVINGAMSAGVFVALVPSILGLVMLDHSRCKMIALILLLVVGLVVSGMGFVFSDNYVQDLVCHVKI